MISKIPRWAWVGSALLAAIAGMVNAVGFRGFEQGVTHLTGSTTLLGLALTRGDTGQSLHLLAGIGSFFSGCVLSGFFIEGSTLELGRRYGPVLLAESMLLILAAELANLHPHLSAYVAACAAGLQNGMLSTYGGSVLRTTHLTGTFTDLGIYVGQRLRGLEIDRRRLRLCLLLIGSFFSGVCLGSWGFARFGYATLYLPAAVTGSAGIAYNLYRRSITRPKA